MLGQTTVEVSTFSLGCGHHPARLHPFGRSCPLQDSSTLEPQRVDFLGFVAGCLSRHHMRSSHLVLPLHVHQILPPECGSGTLLRGAGTWCGSDSEVTLSPQLVSLASCGLTWAAYLHRVGPCAWRGYTCVPASGLASGRPTGTAVTHTRTLPISRTLICYS